MLTDILHDILQHRRLTAWFQPIVDLKRGGIIGYESLIRGPSDSPLHSPASLFAVAFRCGRLVELDLLCREVNIRTFARLRLEGKLFLNVSPSTLLQSDFRSGFTRQFLREHGLSPQQVVIELTEHFPIDDFEVTRKGIDHYREMGFAVAIDDLGAGYAGLRLWSEVKPDFVKFDRHFIQGIAADFHKAQFIRYLQEIADDLGCRTIAEGVETEEECRAVKALGVTFGQGYFFARPSASPLRVCQHLEQSSWGAENAGFYKRRSKTVACLVQSVPAVEPQMRVNEVGDMFASIPLLHSLPVVGEGRIPVGIVHRSKFMDIVGSRYGRDLYGREPIVKFMDEGPLIIEKSLPIERLSQIITGNEQLHHAEDFIIIDKGLYAGTGTVMALLREMTDLQIKHARHANPLTLMPGNVPINEHLEELLQRSADFVVCYCDLDNFKPFNDYHGYSRGDQVIRFLAQLLTECVDGQQDFVGHIGGDDFMVIFQSEDWMERCRLILDRLDQEIGVFYNAEDRDRMGIWGENRKGERVFYPLLSLSIGAVSSIGRQFSSCHDVSVAASEVKRQAKKTEGSSIFVDRRCEQDRPAELLASGIH
jgi:diguanylate cyclase (GGDEF)-like protein